MNKQIIAVSGNVGSGKTTLLKELHEHNPTGSVLILEPLDEWAPYLKAFKATGSLSDLLALQRVVSGFAKSTCETIKANPEKTIFIERTTREHIDIFLDEDITGPDTYKELVDFYEEWNYDKLLTGVIILDVPAEECYKRLSKRRQPGDEGTSLEYIKTLEGKYLAHFKKCEKVLSLVSVLQNMGVPRIGSFVFSGNIGSGKSTAIDKVKSYLEENGVPVVTFRERLDIWGSHLQRFRLTQNPEDLVVFQKVVAECAKDVFIALSTNAPGAPPGAPPVFLIERSVKENIVVFVEPHLRSGLITQEQYDSIVEIWKMWDYDSLTSAVVYLDATPKVCFDRVVTRGQEGDAGITLDYLECLDKIYSSLLDDKIYHNLSLGCHGIEVLGGFRVISPSKVIVFAGNIGSGKSTEIKKLSAKFGRKAKTFLEPVEEWGKDLSAFKVSGSVGDMIRLQKNIASFSKTVYSELLKSENEYYLIERSNHEHLKIFCEPLLETKFLTKDQYMDVTSDYRNYNFDKLITDIVFLDVPHEECFRRVSTRGQAGDDSVDPEYLEYLGKRYSTLYEGKEKTTGFLGEYTRVKF